MNLIILAFHIGGGNMKQEEIVKFTKKMKDGFKEEDKSLQNTKIIRYIFPNRDIHSTIQCVYNGFQE